MTCTLFEVRAMNAVLGLHVHFISGLGLCACSQSGCVLFPNNAKSIAHLYASFSSSSALPQRHDCVRKELTTGFVRRKEDDDDVGSVFSPFHRPASNSFSSPKQKYPGFTGPSRRILLVSSMPEKRSGSRLPLHRLHTLPLICLSPISKYC